MLSPQDRTPPPVATIARNHTPNTITGATAGSRHERACRYAHGLFCHDMDTWSRISGRSGGEEENPTRNIFNARNSFIAASAQHALATVLARNLPDRTSAYFPIGSSSRVADLAKWIGAYRAVAHSSGNLVVGFGRRLPKWHKQKCRTLAPQNGEHHARVIGPTLIDEEDSYGSALIAADPIGIIDDK